MVLEGLGETMLKLRQTNSYCSEVQFRNRRGTCTSYAPREAQSLAGQKKCLLGSPRIATAGEQRRARRVLGGKSQAYPPAPRRHRAPPPSSVPALSRQGFINLIT